MGLVVERTNDAKEDGLHVLIIPSERFLPSDDPVSGIFQYQQAVALGQIGIFVGVLSPQLRRPGKGFLNKKVGGEIANVPADGFHLHTGVRLQILPGRFKAYIRWHWCRLGLRLFHGYIEKYGKPDIIHAHNGFLAGCLAWHISKRYNLPYVVTEHSSIFSYAERTYLSSADIRVYCEASAVLCVSRFLCGRLERSLGKNKITPVYIPNLLDILFEREADVATHQDKFPLRFLCVAQFVPVKNHMGLLHAFARAFPGDSRVELLLGGSGPGQNLLMAEVARLGLGARVKFLGLLSREKVREEMLRCNALVLPSFHETFGVVLIEALACGKPVIAPKGSGPDSIIDKDNGILFDPNGDRDLEVSLVVMASKVNEYNPAAIRQACLEKYSSKNVATQLMALYSSLINKSVSVREVEIKERGEVNE